MWWWRPQPSSTAHAYDLLAKMSGGDGTHFVWSLTGSRETGNNRKEGKSYVVNFGHDVVVVTNSYPLQIGLNGASLLIGKFRLLKGDFELYLEGDTFQIGENLRVKIGKLRRGAAVLCEFCEIRWAASASYETSGMSSDLSSKLELPSNRFELSPNFSKINWNTPFGDRHVALQVVKLYEEVTMDRV